MGNKKLKKGFQPEILFLSNIQYITLNNGCMKHVDHIHLFIFHGYIANSQYDQLPVDLIAQLVEHCTGIGRGHGLECR